MDNIHYTIHNEEKKLRIQDRNENTELMIKIDLIALEHTILSEEGVRNVLITMHSILLNEGPYYSIFVKKSNALILAKKERVIEGKTVINVYNVIDSPLYINSGIFTYDFEEFVKRQ